MSEQKDVKVFISWSGELSKAVALALRAWLPSLSDRVKPWASEADIEAGSRGLTQIEQELAGTQFGIVVVTAENQHRPWINFEAGALSKAIPGEADKRVVPLLVDLSGPTQLTGPLSQFQAKLANESGLRDVLHSLAQAAGVDETLIDGRFVMFWPQLQEQIKAALETSASEGKPQEKRRPQQDVLDEILLLVRQIRADGEPSYVMSNRHKPEIEVGLARMALSRGFRLDQTLRYLDGRVEVHVSPHPTKNIPQPDFPKFADDLQLEFGFDYRATLNELRADGSSGVSIF